jgi:hypothetical protein
MGAGGGLSASRSLLRIRATPYSWLWPLLVILNLLVGVVVSSRRTG